MTLDNVLHCIKKYFNIIAVIPIIEYDYNLRELYSVLASLKKERYESNDRIVFIFDDPDYYHKNQYGFTLHNLQKILTQLDIPNYFCLILTHQSYMKLEAETLAKELTYDLLSISVFDIWLDIYLDISSIPYVDFNFNSIEKSFVFLSRVTRKHRGIMFSLLQDGNLLDNGIVSFSLNNGVQSLVNQTGSLIFPDDISLLSTVPQTRCNESWLITDSQLRNLYSKFLNTANKNFIFKNFDEPHIIPDQYTKANSFITQRAFLYVAVETMFYYPGTYISEKSFKGISAKRPFVILGPQGNLQKLKDYGFKTFNHWWSEDYDNIVDPCERLIAVYKIIQTLNNMPINSLIALGKEMQEVLQYNYDFLINEFAASQLKNLDTQCVRNLNR